MLYEDNFIPFPPNETGPEIDPIANFVSRKICSLKRTLDTSTDIEEKIDTISEILMCEASIALLTLAYLTENASLIEDAKNIYRGI
jgi:hypothetical protein